MGQISMLFVSFILLFLSNSIEAQTSSDFFVGDWNVAVTGTPNGDSNMVLHLERVDGKLTGEIKSDNPVKLTKVEENETSVTVYYSMMGYDIYLSLEKVDKNNVKGSLMGMFDAKGERVIN